VHRAIYDSMKRFPGFVKFARSSNAAGLVAQVQSGLSFSAQHA